MRAIAMTVYNRPEYTAETLERLNACYGIDRYELFIQADRGDPAVIDVVNDFSGCPVHLERNPERLDE